MFPVGHDEYDPVRLLHVKCISNPCLNSQSDPRSTYAIPAIGSGGAASGCVGARRFWGLGCARMWVHRFAPISKLGGRPRDVLGRRQGRCDRSS